jgi:hypothetical protein
MKGALAIVAAVAGLGAVTGLGKDLDKTHSAVVAVSVDGASSNFGPASGTLVSGRVVVTAGHVSPVPRPDLPQWAVAIGPNAFKAEKRIRLDPETNSRPNPLFLSYVEQFGRNPSERVDFVDIGLLVLPEPAGVPAVALPAPRMLDRLSKTDRFLAVGYGYHEIIRANDPGGAAPDGNRRQWRAGIRVLNAAWVQLEDDPAKGYGQICRGDSGAPILLERGGHETLVAVVSHSDGQGCGPGIPTYAARVDNPPVLTWIQEAVAAAR